VSQTSPATAEQAFCANCGRQFTAGVAFCAGCGRQRAEAALPVVAPLAPPRPAATPPTPRARPKISAQTAAYPADSLDAAAEPIWADPIWAGRPEAVPHDEPPAGDHDALYAAATGPAEAPAEGISLPPATYGERAAARLLDAVFAGAVGALPLLAWVGAVAYRHGAGDTAQSLGLVIAYAFWPVLLFLYYAGGGAWRGGSPGRTAIGLRVVKLDRSGRVLPRVGLGSALLRALGRRARRPAARPGELDDAAQRAGPQLGGPCLRHRGGAGRRPRRWPTARLVPGVGTGRRGRGRRPRPHRRLVSTFASRAGRFGESCTAASKRRQSVLGTVLWVALPARIQCQTSRIHCG